MPYDPFMDCDTKGGKPQGAAGRGQFARPGNDYTTYIWEGREFLRVTSVLDLASSKGLQPWWGKMAAMSAAAPLVAAGAIAIHDLPGADELNAYMFSRGPLLEFQTGDYDADLAAAIRSVVNWPYHMIDGERRRDEKGWIGTAVHVAAHEHALGNRIRPADRVDYLAGIAHNHRLIPSDVLDRFAEYGRSEAECYMGIGFIAKPYLDGWIDWVEAYEPEWEYSGMESAVFHEGELYAGTLDATARVRESAWRMNGKAWGYPGQPVATIVVDFKTSNDLWPSYKLQVSAYARAEFIGDYSTETRTPLPDFDGAGVLHIKPDGPAELFEIHGRESLDYCFEGFCGLHAYARVMKNLPRMARARQYAPPRATKQRVPEKAPF